MAIVLSGPSVQINAFRGTDDIKDWVTNVKILPGSTPWGNVHSGFLSATEALWPEICAILDHLPNSRKKIWFTGHSLGAAMAVLCSMKLTLEKNSKVSGIYTFGQPLIGSVNFCKSYDQQLENKLFRFELPRDEVPNQPGGYFPVGTLKYLDRHGKLRTNPKSFWKFKDQLWRDSLGLLGEHSMLEYLRQIEQLQEMATTAGTIK